MQVAESAPLVGEREDLSSLVKEYAENDVVYQAKIQVSKQWLSFRHVPRLSPSSNYSTFDSLKLPRAVKGRKVTRGGRGWG